MNILVKSVTSLLSAVTVFSSGVSFSAQTAANPSEPGTATVQWTQMENIDGYDVLRAETKDGDYEQIARIEDNSIIEYKDSEVTVGRLYYYKVKWYKKVGSLTVRSDATRSAAAIPQLSEAEPIQEPIKKSKVDADLSTDPDNILMLVNKSTSLSPDYVPTNLVSLGDYGTGGQTAKGIVKSSFALLYDEASKAGFTIKVVSGYRSYGLQSELYAYWCDVDGVAQANRTSAKPGKSEHQTGYALDVSCQSEGWDLQQSFGSTPEGIWLAENAHKYGFIIRYGQNQESITGYAYEPWHIRYVGAKAAGEIYRQGITLEEYLQ